MVGEDGELGFEDVTSLGTFTLYRDRLEFFGLSEARLAQAVALVERRLGRVAGRLRRRVRSVEDAAGAAQGPRAAPTQGASRPRRASRRLDDGSMVPDARIRALTYRRWIDDPNERLRGLSPREAASAPEHREELERQLRSLEHHNARERDDGRPGAEVSWLRAELGLESQPLAA